MEPINNWHGIEEAGAYEKIELGGHICFIKAARCETTKSGGKMIVIAFDLASDDKQAGFYQNQFDENKKKDANTKWRGTYYQMYGNDVSNPFFKAFINRIMESNPGYQWDWDEKGLVNKRFGGVFGREEYINDKGEYKFTTKCMRIQNLDGILEVVAPEDKVLKKDAKPQGGFTLDQASHPLEINDDDLPF